MTESTTKLSDHAISEIDRWIRKYPEDQKQSAVLAALREAQHENQGYLTPELMDAVADYLDMPRIAVYEVASFYSMLETRPVGNPAPPRPRRPDCFTSSSTSAGEIPSRRILFHASQPPTL